MAVTRSANIATGAQVLVTGHTGFKGGWLAEWLLHLGAKVSGISLPPEVGDGFFTNLRLEERVGHFICDIRNGAQLADCVEKSDPEIIFHLAAQALVGRGYREPLVTWETNVLGTLNLLEAARRLKRPVTVIVVTTDKVYKNREWEYSYRETDELGGRDPYSASKAACEFAVDSWRASFGARDGVSVVTARAGNVLGAGDFSLDRIVPDCFRAWATGEPVMLRYPKSTRPWQHVLEPLSGYIALAARVAAGDMDILQCNFGPGVAGDKTVEELVGSFAKLAPNRKWAVDKTAARHEARALSLSIDRARHKLGWCPKLTFEEAIEWTNAGYVASKKTLSNIVLRQISDYEAREKYTTAKDFCGPNA